ncbi:MAG: response regulator transcription factor [Anaerolineales bacterium]|nr:response regulator transcription factor [Anaerolineales bacterium]
MASTEKLKILIVDDDKTLLLFLEKFFREEGYEVFSADRGRSALKTFYEQQPDLVVLDLMMPGMDGWEVCARIRELAETPIILLSAKSGEAEKLRGFRLGVDDYVTKPFSMAELAARSQAVLHRARPARKEEEITAGPLKINLKKKEVDFEGKSVDLTPTEFRLLLALAQRSGETISQEELHEKVWGEYSSSRQTALRRYIWLLRQKLERDPASPTLLVAVRGFGYRLDTD